MIATSLSGASLHRRYGCCVAHFYILQVLKAEFVRSLNPNAAYAKCSLIALQMMRPECDASSEGRTSHKLHQG